MTAKNRNRYEVVLVGFEEGENLGLRYIAGYLMQFGIRTLVLPYHPDQGDVLLAAIRRAKPRLVGFSLIFQRLLHQFGALISYLRHHGLKCHFTMGGHFPSIAPRETMQAIPELDSVIRGEGEITTLELFRHIDAQDDWSSILGLTYRRRNRIRSSPARPAIRDLDKLPHPARSQTALEHRGISIGTLIASRGCYFDCSFCSIHRFYREAPGPRRRSRSPESVVAEMKLLYEQEGTRIFVFEDDDFIIRGRKQAAWIEAFCSALRCHKLSDRIGFRISCRVDDVSREVLEPLRHVGLMCVYLGIESGNSRGLRLYNKHYTVDDAARAIELLSSLDIPYEFGFMLLNPESTFDTIYEDIRFLGDIGRSGQAVVHFTKMLPYTGTAIEKRLRAQRRLEGTVEYPDYSFRDARIDLYQMFLTQAFHARNFDPDGLVERLRHAKLDALAVQRFFSDKWDGAAYAGALAHLIQATNEQCVETLGLAAELMRQSTVDEVYERWGMLERLAQKEKQAEHYMTAALDSLMASFGYYDHN